MEKAKSKLPLVTVLFTAHLINDMYANFLPQLVAILVSLQSISVGAGSALVSAFTVSSSIVQPVFGYLVDQKGQRWLLFVGTLWMSVLLGLTGYISSGPLLFIICALAGLGTAAFHPQAAGIVGQVTKTRKGLMMSSFIAMGNVGLAISPLLFLPLLNSFGITYTWVVILPGVLSAVLLYKYVPVMTGSGNGGPTLGQVFGDLKKSSMELLKLMFIVSIRSLVHTGLMTLLPVYFLSQKYSATITGYMVFVVLAAGAIGGVLGGHISDRFGKKPVIVWSMILSFVFFNAFFLTQGTLSIALLTLGGMSLLSSFSVTVVIAQEIIPENKALAAGLSLGFAIGIGGLAVSLIGEYAEVYGVGSAIHLLFYLPLAAGLLGFFLKEEKSAKQQSS